MRKIFYAVSALLVMGMVACDEDHGTYGDYSIASELELESAISLCTGQEIPLEVESKGDTIYKYFKVEKDTLKDASGNYVTGSDGNLTITYDTTYYFSNITATLVKMKPIVLEPDIDTIKINIKSNARWYAPVPTFQKTQWMYNVNSTLSGGGDSYTIFTVGRNRAKKRSETAPFYIYTQDSTVMYYVPIDQKGERD